MKKIRFGVIGAGGIADRRTIPGMLKCDAFFYHGGAKTEPDKG